MADELPRTGRTRTRRPPAGRALAGGLLGLAVSAGVAVAAAPGDGPGAADGDGDGDRRSMRSRLVERFDFEDAAAVPVEFPEWWRNLADDLGLPRFGRMRLSDERSATGDWSFRFDPDGVPLAAGVPSGVLLVYPMTDYRVSCRVATDGLRHGTAQLVAAFCGPDGSIIESSVRRSRAIRSEQGWSRLEVLVPGVHDTASSLVVELHLLQPERTVPHGDIARPPRPAAIATDGTDAASVPVPAAAAPRDPDGPPVPGGDAGPASSIATLDAAVEAPVLVDVSGHAWFDDVRVEHRTRVDLEVNGRAGVVVSPARPSLGVRVRDLTTAGLRARLEVTDADGQLVHVDRIDRLVAGRRLDLDLPLTRSGWYRARLVVEADGMEAGERTLDFCVVPPRRRRTAAADRPVIGLVLGARDGRIADLVPALVHDTGAGLVTVPVWPPSDPDVAELAPVIARLLEHDVDVVAELGRMRPALARAAGTDPEDVARTLAADPDGWRADLEPLAIAHGLRIGDWVLGPVRPPAGPDAPGPTADDVAAAAALVAGVLPGPVPVASVPVWATADPRGPGRRIVRVLPHVRAEDVGAAADDPADHVLLEPDPTLTGRAADLDLALRLLHAWRGGHRVTLVPAPWTVAGDPALGPSVTPAYPVIRTLADALAGRRFAGELPLGSGVTAWLIDGGPGGHDALVAWRDGLAGDAPRPLTIRLGAGPVRAIDLRGNERIVPVNEDARHRVMLGTAPLLLEDVDLPLLRFRASIALEPKTLPAIYRAHDVELVLTNPWPMGIAGTVFLGADPGDPERAGAGPAAALGGVLNPSRVPFTLQPGETLRRPLSAVFDRAVAAGEQRIPAVVLVEALEVERLRIDLPVTIGWRDVDLTAAWQLQSGDGGSRSLLVRIMVTNRGTEPVELDAFLRGPGLGRQRRPMARLDPGVTATRSFLIEDGVAGLGGTTLRYGVAERGGSAQLNKALVLPRFAPGPNGTRAAVEP